MTTITPELRQAIEQAGEKPVRFFDPETHTAYVIVKEEVFQRMQALLEIDRVDRSLYEFGEFLEDEEDRREKEAWAKLGRKARSEWAKSS